MRFGPFMIVALILFALWAGGFEVFHAAGHGDGDEAWLDFGAGGKARLKLC